jgi:hypothetical protein
MNASSILKGLPRSGNLEHIVNNGDGYIKQPKTYELKHAKEPLNYRDGPNYVQKVENYMMSIAEYQKTIVRRRAEDHSSEESAQKIRYDPHINNLEMLAPGISALLTNGASSQP